MSYFKMILIFIVDLQEGCNEYVLEGKRNFFQAISQTTRNLQFTTAVKFLSIKILHENQCPVKTN